jgi:hypothetical protein
MAEGDVIKAKAHIISQGPKAEANNRALALMTSTFSLNLDF